MSNLLPYCKDLPTTPVLEIGVVLVTGATGYIGGRLVRELIERGYKVRVMVRSYSAEYLDRWPGAEVIVADATSVDQLKKALNNVSVAYYLIHSMLVARKRFMSSERQVVENFRLVAEEMNVRRIIYLGSQGIEGVELKGRYRDRIQVGELLMQGSVPVTILLTPLTIGSGSASFEIINHIVSKYPVLFLPYWARKKCRPIGIRDLLKYLVGVLEIPVTSGNIYNIGGEDVLSYLEMNKILAKLLGKRRLFLPSPVSSIRFYSYFISLLTPVPAQIAVYILRGIKNELEYDDAAIRKHLDFKPVRFKEALKRALSQEEHDTISTRWSDAYPPAHELSIKLTELSESPKYNSKYSIITDKGAPEIFQSICHIGGNIGWFNTSWMWRLRGLIDRIFLGVGTSRGRRSVNSLRINDVIDFWRVEDMIDKQRLLLRAEMILPGKAWLEFFIEAHSEQNEITVIAHFHTKSVLGKLYWYSFLPFHYFIFKDLLKQLSK
ncbi:MAG: SDR family oxidoreductase [Bacteroidia bacterium]|nr:MAG: SDR family oxidoreductase [Bacteroidia bacterium]